MNEGTEVEFSEWYLRICCVISAINLDCLCRFHPHNTKCNRCGMLTSMKKNWPKEYADALHGVAMNKANDN